LNISWTNPMNNILSGYKVYIDGVEKTGDFDLTPGAFNELYVDGLNNYQKYNIKLVESCIGRENYEYTVTGMPNDAPNHRMVGAWDIDRFSTFTDFTDKKASYPNNIFELEKDGINTAMRIDVNLPEIIPNLYPNMVQKLTLDNTTDYKLSFRAKTKNAHRFWVNPKVSFTDNNGVYHEAWTPIIIANGDSEWKTYEVMLNADNIKCTKADCEDKNVFFTSDERDLNLNLFFALESAEGSAWIDDVTLYAYDSWDEVTTGSNLIKNGDFEFGYEILKPEFKLIKEDGEKQTISEICEGTIEVTAKIKNYSEENFKPFVGFALYNGNKLEKIITVTNDSPIEITGAVVPADEFRTQIVVPALESGDWSVKVIYWENIESLNPLASADILREAVVAE